MLWASQARTQTHKQKNPKRDTEESPETGLVFMESCPKRTTTFHLCAVEISPEVRLARREPQAVSKGFLS